MRGKLLRKYKALLSVAVLAGGLVVAEGQPVSASVPTAPALVNTTSPIKHVVVIYQENHSFDNVLGDVCQARLTRCDRLHRHGQAEDWCSGADDGVAGRISESRPFGCFLDKGY